MKGWKAVFKPSRLRQADIPKKLSASKESKVVRHDEEKRKFYVSSKKGNILFIVCLLPRIHTKIIYYGTCKMAVSVLLQ